MFPITGFFLQSNQITPENFEFAFRHHDPSYKILLYDSGFFRTGSNIFLCHVLVAVAVYEHTGVPLLLIKEQNPYYLYYV